MSPEQKELRRARKERHFERVLEGVRFAVSTVVDLVKQPLFAGFAGYFAAHQAGRIGRYDASGEFIPYMKPETTAALKAVAGAYPVMSALGGFAGLAGGTATGLGIYGANQGFTGLSALQNAATPITSFLSGLTGNPLLTPIVRGLLP